MLSVVNKFNRPKAYYDWDEIIANVLEIAQQMETSQYLPDAIVGIKRGGVIPSMMLSMHIGSNWVELQYPWKNEPEAANKFSHSLFEANRGLEVLILDDISDTGETFEPLVRIASDYCNVKTACIIQNLSSKFLTDFSGETIDKAKDDCWVVFPWERDYGDET